MKRPIVLTTGLVAAALVAAATATQETETQVSLTSATYLAYEPETRTGIEARVAAAKALFEAVSDEKRAELRFELDDPEWANWTNLPTGEDEPGLRLGDCTEAELRAAFDLLATLLSPTGYARVRDIVLADDRLLRNGRPRTGFGAENFWLCVFGDPSKDERWGIQFDGHHLGLNIWVDGDVVSMSPSFLGAQPARFERGKERVAPLGDIQTAAYEIAGSLTDEQKGVAVVGAKRGANAAAAGKDGVVPEVEGIACSALGSPQRKLVLGLIAQVVRFLPTDVAESRAKELARELDDMHFSWRGPTDDGADASYRLQGPTLLIECAGQNLGGDPTQHLHLMYRGFDREYGKR